MTFAFNMLGDIRMVWTSLYRALKAMVAIAAYLLALTYTLYGVTMGIALSYVAPHTFVVIVWALIVLTSMVVWSAASWVILLMTLVKKRADAHLLLLPISLYATIAVGSMALFAAFAGMNATSGLDALGFAVLFSTIAYALLHFFIGHAVKVWQGADLP
jgi:hypothetical protein